MSNSIVIFIFLYILLKLGLSFHFSLPVSTIQLSFYMNYIISLLLFLWHQNEDSIIKLLFRNCLSWFLFYCDLLELQSVSWSLDPGHLSWSVASLLLSLLLSSLMVGFSLLAISSWDSFLYLLSPLCLQ